MGGRVAKMSGRGLGHTGGTIDKLEAIPGFQTSLPRERFLRQVEEIGLCVAGQTGELAPADKALYSLRDATSTAQHADASAILAGDIHVIRNRHDRLVVSMLGVVIGAIPLIFDLALKAHLDGALLFGHQPHFAAWQPKIRQLRLPAIHNFLLENAIFVEDRITGGQVSLRGKAVHFV